MFEAKERDVWAHEPRCFTLRTAMFFTHEQQCIFQGTAMTDTSPTIIYLPTVMVYVNFYVTRSYYLIKFNTYKNLTSRTNIHHFSTIHHHSAIIIVILTILKKC